MLAAFVGDPFCSRGRELALSRWGVKGTGSGQSRVKAAKVRVAKDRGGKHAPGRPEARWPESQEQGSFVLRIFIIGGVGVKKLHID